RTESPAITAVPSPVRPSAAPIARRRVSSGPAARPAPAPAGPPTRPPPPPARAPPPARPPPPPPPPAAPPPPPPPPPRRGPPPHPPLQRRLPRGPRDHERQPGEHEHDVRAQEVGMRVPAVGEEEQRVQGQAGPRRRAGQHACGDEQANGYLDQGDKHS